MASSVSALSTADGGAAGSPAASDPGADAGLAPVLSAECEPSTYDGQQLAEPGTTLATDLPDYAPGSTALIYGSGFAPGECVTLKVEHADGVPEGGAGHEAWGVLADDDGNLVTTWLVDPDDSLGSTLRATATSPSGHYAEVTFTDGLSPAYWTAINSFIPERQSAQMAYDSLRGRSVVFGGFWASGLRGDTWEWNGTAWMRRGSGGSEPSARGGGCLAFDSARGVVVAFAGGDGNTYNNDTWEWNGATWTQRNVSVRPVVRYDCAMAYDAARHKVVLFGGFAYDLNTFVIGNQNDTWEWDGVSWTQITPTGSVPTPRSRSAMAYDAVRQRVVMYGGITGSGTVSNEVWEWDGSAWTNRTPATGNPNARGGAALVYDSARDRSVMFGGYNGASSVFGDTWDWNGATGSWTQRSTTGPLARQIHGMAYDSARQRTVMFGGFNAGVSGLAYLGDTWEFNGTTGTWTQRTNSVASVARTMHGMVYDASGSRTVMFGGYAPSTAVASTQTWNGTSWSNIGGGPSARGELAMAYDSGRSRVVVFGGQTARNSGITQLNDTWELSGSTWAQRTPTTIPAVRSKAAMAYDAARAQSVLFGGALTTGASPTLTNQTYVWDGTNWTLKAPATSPTVRRSHAMAYDAARGRIVLFGGIGTSNVYRNDTWEWDGTNWAQRATTGPSARANATMTYDAGRGRVILWGGSNGSQTLSDIWEWNGAAGQWILRVSASGDARYGHAMVYDGARGKLVAFGGEVSTSALNALANETWENIAYGGACATSADCAYGQCISGVCCFTAATSCGQCQACNLSGSVGFCSVTPNGSACTDGNACTQVDACSAGSCVGSNPVTCTALDQCHQAGTCDTLTGSCNNPARADGTACNDGDACTQLDACSAGACTGGNPVQCTAQDQCHVAGSCNSSSGLCSNPNAAEGLACDDGNGDTVNDVCSAGACSGTDLCAGVTCSALDQCHLAGVCDHQTGDCSDPNAADGTSCNDGSADTVNDVCSAGSCAGVDLCAGVICAPQDQCHVAGTCDHQTGQCSNPAELDGTACDDGNTDTVNDACTAGACAGVDLCAGVTCAALDQCHVAGTCDHQTGLCSHPTVADGTGCDDGNGDTVNDVCSAGSCAGVDLCAGVTCVAQDQCHVAGTCDHQTGLCSNPEAPNGTTCSDGDACSQTDTCNAGACVGTNPVVCTASDECHVAGVCNPASGVCSNPEQADGTLCSDDGNVCTLDRCQAGSCEHPAGNAGTECRPSHGVCDAADVCDGVSTACADLKHGGATVCRASADVCDAAETCDGSGDDCPSDAKVGAGTACTADADACTADVCDGSSDGCQHVFGDQAAPTFEPGVDQVVAGNCAGAPVAYAVPDASDGCDADPVVTCPVVSGNSYGDHLVTCTAVDSSGNTGSVSFHVNVLEPIRIAARAPLEDGVSNLAKAGAKVPHRVKLWSCSDQDVTYTAAVSTKIGVTLKTGTTGGGNTIGEVPDTADSGGTMAKVCTGTDCIYQYVLGTKGYDVTVGSPTYYESLVTTAYTAYPVVVVGSDAIVLETK